MACILFLIHKEEAGEEKGGGGGEDVGEGGGTWNEGEEGEGEEEGEENEEEHHVDLVLIQRRVGSASHLIFSISEYVDLWPVLSPPSHLATNSGRSLYSLWLC